MVVCVPGQPVAEFVRECHPASSGGSLPIDDCHAELRSCGADLNTAAIGSVARECRRKGHQPKKLTEPAEVGNRGGSPHPDPLTNAHRRLLSIRVGAQCPQLHALTVDRVDDAHVEQPLHVRRERTQFLFQQHVGLVRMLTVASSVHHRRNRLGHEERKRPAQRLGNHQEFGDADLALTPLDAAHRATVQAKSLAQRALGASDHLPRTRDALTQLPGVHACDFRTRRAGRQTWFRGQKGIRVALTEEQKAAHAAKPQLTTALKEEERALRKDARRGQWYEQDLYLTREQALAGEPCGGCGLPVIDNLGSWPDTMHLSPEEHTQARRRPEAR